MDINPPLAHDIDQVLTIQLAGRAMSEDATLSILDKMFATEFGYSHAFVRALPAFQAKFPQPVEDKTPKKES